ncbi:heavy metal-responsive transcriptional regulator [candidate division KSB1 bacterium]|nr:heavy metal-responsive transcriptional regulator [candidate division KSB1 bacterium]
MKTMTRGELAKLCGVNIEALRYYEKRGLIDPPERSDAGYRLYTSEDAAKIRFIRNAQKLGFTLNEIMELLKLRVHKNENCGPVLQKAQKKLDEVERKIKGLKSMKKVLNQLIHQCEESALTSACPILASFETDRKL